MTLWEKIKDGFGAGVETVSVKTEELTNLAKLNYKKFKLTNELKTEINKLGILTYELYLGKKENDLLKESEPIIKKIKELEIDINELNNKIKIVSDQGTVEKENLFELKKDLQLGDGVIEQVIINSESKIVGKKLKEIKLPNNVLIGAIVRNEKVIIPSGDTEIMKEDKLTLLGEKEEVSEALLLIK
jgi:K+/H+ antiporter YhaU regulatory subunit KhtT